MASFSDTLNSANTLLDGAVRFGIALAGAFLVYQVLFPSGEASGIVTSVSNLVGQFTSGGLTGLVTLLLFMTFMRR